MVGHVICHAIGRDELVFRSSNIEAAERAFSAISDARAASFASEYQQLGAAPPDFPAPPFGTAA